MDDGTRPWTKEEEEEMMVYINANRDTKGNINWRNVAVSMNSKRTKAAMKKKYERLAGIVYGVEKRKSSGGTVPPPSSSSTSSTGMASGPGKRGRGGSNLVRGRSSGISSVEGAETAPSVRFVTPKSASHGALLKLLEHSAVKEDGSSVLPESSLSDCEEEIDAIASILDRKRRRMRMDRARKAISQAMSIRDGPLHGIGLSRSFYALDQDEIFESFVRGDLHPLHPSSERSCVATMFPSYHAFYGSFATSTSRPAVVNHLGSPVCFDVMIGPKRPCLYARHLVRDGAHRRRDRRHVRATDDEQREKRTVRESASCPLSIERENNHVAESEIIEKERVEATENIDPQGSSSYDDVAHDKMSLSGSTLSTLSS